MTAQLAEEGELEIIQAAHGSPRGRGVTQRLQTNKSIVALLAGSKRNLRFTHINGDQTNHTVLPHLHTPPLLVNTKVKGHQPWAASLSPLRFPCPDCLECHFQWFHLHNSCREETEWACWGSSKRTIIILLLPSYS